jgi:hypothetical protein
LVGDIVTYDHLHDVTQTVETLPDGTNTNMVFTNGLSEAMLTAFADGSGHQWLTYNRYDSSGWLILTASPSAVTGYSSYAELVDYTGGSSSDLSGTSGLITDSVYATGTTATTPATRNAAGYLDETAVQQGQTGTPVVLEASAYIENTAGRPTTSTSCRTPSTATPTGQAS